MLSSGKDRPANARDRTPQSLVPIFRSPTPSPSAMMPPVEVPTISLKSSAAAFPGSRSHAANIDVQNGPLIPFPSRLSTGNLNEIRLQSVSRSRQATQECVRVPVIGVSPPAGAGALLSLSGGGRRRSTPATPPWHGRAKPLARTIRP